jgi:hypothetical protein
MKHFVIAVLILLACVGRLSAQAPGNPWCLSHELTLEYLREQGIEGEIAQQLPQPTGELRGGGTPVIPVVFHIVWNTAQDNIPESTIQMMLDQMNADYSGSNPELSSVRSAFTSSIGNPGMQFCLAQFDPAGNPASGIVRVQTTATWFSPNSQPHAMKQPPLGSSAWDPTRYLNIWVCDIVGTSGNIVSGYSYLPVGGMAGSWQDGLVIDAFHGTTYAARTATHEAGHYFGLRHPFDGNSCFTDDGIADTPNTDNPAWNCNNVNMQKCGVLTQYENFMDYSTCLAMFTNQQASFMQQVLNGTRASLLNSTGCGEIGTGSNEFARQQVQLHPNPASEQVTLTVPQGYLGQAAVKDLQGRVVQHVPLTGTTSTFSTTGLRAGTYLVEVLHEKGTMTIRFVAQ